MLKGSDREFLNKIWFITFRSHPCQVLNNVNRFYQSKGGRVQMFLVVHLFFFFKLRFPCVPSLYTLLLCFITWNTRKILSVCDCNVTKKFSISKPLLRKLILVSKPWYLKARTIVTFLQHWKRQKDLIPNSVLLRRFLSYLSTSFILLWKKICRWCVASPCNFTEYLFCFLSVYIHC